MFKRNIVIAIRNFSKNKLHNSINLLGLSIGIACCVMILVYVSFQFSFDNFHKKSDKIFQVLFNFPMTAEVEYVENTPGALAETLLKDIPEIKNAVRVFIPWPMDKPTIAMNNNIFTEAGFIADEKFFEIFSYRLLKGDKKTVLIEPNNILITERLSKKLFGLNDPLGKIITYKWLFGTHNVKIAGIIADPPANSNLQFDYIISFPTILNEKLKNNLSSWGNLSLLTYLELKDPNNKSIIEEKCNKSLYNAGGYKGRPYDSKHIALESIKDSRLNSKLKEKDGGAGGRVKELYIFGIIAMIILAMAMINYVNLTSSKALTRSKEVGIKKVIGAGKKELFLQFILESLTMVSIAGISAIFLAILFVPLFNSYTGQTLTPGNILNIPMLIIIIMVILLIGLLAGLIPSFVLTSFQPSRVLGEFSSKGKFGGRIRNIFVVIQFGTAVVLIFSLFVIKSQMDFIRKTNLGYNREQILILKLSDPETRKQSFVLRDMMKQLNCVADASVASFSPINIVSWSSGFTATDANGKEKVFTIHQDYVDDNYINVYKLNLIKGRNFLPEEVKNNNAACIVNEQYAKTIGADDPVGMVIPNGGSGTQIVGMVKDFNFNSLHNKIEPLVLWAQGNGSSLAIKLNNKNIESSIAEIKSLLSSFLPSTLFDFTFADDNYYNLYKDEVKMGELFNFTSFIALIIAGLGLMGLSSFAMAKRIKEISIRKICGASTAQIYKEISKSFILLIGIAAFIALPCAYYLSEKWLNDFAFRVQINVWNYVATILVVIIVALFSISYQTFKAASINPVESLKSE